MYKLASKYDQEINAALENFKEKYDKLLQEGEIEKKTLILTIADCLKKNFEEMGTFEMMRNNIASIVISIINTSNIVSISSEWIIRVLKPLGYTNIYARHKNIEQVKDENKAVRELNSSIIFTNNVLKDLSVYKADIKDTINKLKNSEFKHFDDQELIKAKEELVVIYQVLNGHINSRQESITDRLKNEPDNKPFGDNKGTEEEQDDENEEEDDDDYIDEEEDTNLEDDIKRDAREMEEEYKKIDKPKNKPKFENRIPALVNRIFEGYKLVAKYMKKYHTVVSNYPEFDKEFHDKYCYALEAHAEFIEGMAEYIKPHTNLKFRRDGIGWVEIAEVADKYTEGAACSRSGVPAKYYDDQGNLKEDKRRLTKEHITENMPTAKKLKKVIEKTNQYWMALNQYYLRNIQPWTVGYTKKSHDRLSNSA